MLMVEIAIGDSQRLGRTTAVAVDLVGEVVDRARAQTRPRKAAVAMPFASKSDHRYCKLQRNTISRSPPEKRS